MRQIFDAMDQNNNNLLEPVEVQNHAGKIELFFMQHGVSRDDVLSKEEEETLSFNDVKERFLRGRELLRKKQGLSEIGLLRIIAECVEGGSPAHPLEWVFGMSDDEISAWVAGPVSKKLSKAFIDKRDEMAAAARQKDDKEFLDKSNEKYAMHDVAHFGPIEDYYKVLPAVCPSFPACRQTPHTCQNSFLFLVLRWRCRMHSQTSDSDRTRSVKSALCN